MKKRIIWVGAIIGGLLILFIAFFPYSLLPFIAISEGVFGMSDSEIAAVTNEAVLTKNLSLCAKVPERKGWNNLPLNNCIQKTIVSIGNADLCIDHSSFTTQCVDDVAASTSNLKACDTILKISQTVNAYRESYVDECYLEVITKNHRFGECSKVPFSSNDPRFLDRCYHSSALYNKDPSICEKIADDFQKRACIQNASN